MAITPEQLAKAGTEHAHQTAFFCWLYQAANTDSRLAFAFAIPNGGERGKVQASRLKAEGVKVGVPDIFIPIPVMQEDDYFLVVKYCGLWIEMKRPDSEGKKAGLIAGDQLRWQEYLISQEYCHKVAFGYCQAIEYTIEYLKQDVEYTTEYLK